MEIVTRSALCICMLVLVSAEMPAAQTSRVRLDLARENGPAISHGDARSLLRSGDRILRDIDRNRQLRARREAIDAELDRRLAAGARGRLTADNRRLEEDIERLRREIVMTRRGSSLFRVMFSIGIRLVVTAVTGNPIIGAAAGGAIDELAAGGGIAEALGSAMVSAATAWAGQEIATAVVGGDWDTATTLERAVGAGTAGGATGGARAGMRGGSAEEIVAGVGLGFGIAAGLELAASGITGPGGTGRESDTTTWADDQSAEEMLAELGVELERGDLLAAAVAEPGAGPGRLVVHFAKWAKQKIDECRKNKDCMDYIRRRNDDVVQDVTRRTGEEALKAARKAMEKGPPVRQPLPLTQPGWICAYLTAEGIPCAADGAGSSADGWDGWTSEW